MELTNAAATAARGIQKLQWHPAFSSALQIELAEDRDKLQFSTEYSLTRKPLVIDILIIKKTREYPCRDPIAGFFRGHNIIEYKNPKESFGIDDLLKVLAYAGIYQSNTEKEGRIDPEDITITIVCGRYPRKVMQWLKTMCKVTFYLYEPGIYRPCTDRYFPIQFVINTQLDPKRYKWLSRLRSDLTLEEDVEVLAREYRGKEKSPLYETAMDVIMRANEDVYKEARTMCQALRELFADELQERENKGIRQGIEQGMEKGITQGIEKGIAQGIEKGIVQGREEGEWNILVSLVKQGLLQSANAAKQLNISEEEFTQRMCRTACSN